MLVLICQPTSCISNKENNPPGSKTADASRRSEATCYRSVVNEQLQKVRELLPPNPWEDIRSCFLKEESGWCGQHFYPGSPLICCLGFLSRGLSLKAVEMRRHNGAWPSVRGSQHPEEVQRNPRSGDVDVEDFHFHFLSRT